MSQLKEQAGEMMSSPRAGVRERFHEAVESRRDDLGLRIEPGTLADYRALERFHYRGRHPGGVTSVLCMRRIRPSVVSRFAAQAAALRNHDKTRRKAACVEMRCAQETAAWECAIETRCAREGGSSDNVRNYVKIRNSEGIADGADRDDHSELVGVLVRTLPPLACRMRDDATAGRYANLAPRDAAVMLNREIRTISRVVIDPRYRGLGLAVKLVRHALEHPEPHDPPLRFTEALAAMGHVSPFFERAGMKRFERPLRSEHLRLVDALQHIGLRPEELVSLRHVHDRLALLSPAAGAWFERELRRWHRAAHRVKRDKLAAVSLDALLQIARSKLLSRPVYYIHQHATKQTPGASSTPNSL